MLRNPPTGGPFDSSSSEHLVPKRCSDDGGRSALVGMEVERLDLGGGLGVVYTDENPPEKIQRFVADQSLVAIENLQLNPDTRIIIATKSEN